MMVMAVSHWGLLCHMLTLPVLIAPEEAPPPSCSAPSMLPLNGAVSPDWARFEPGDDVFYYCDKGFSLHGQGCAICGADGKWMPEPVGDRSPVCVLNASHTEPRNVGPFVPTRRNSRCNLVTGAPTRTDVEARFRHSFMQLETFPAGSPWLEPEDTKVDGLAFLGLSFARNTPAEPLSNTGTISRQTQFDFSPLLDRTYSQFAGTSDDGWLAGGGENGDSFKLTARDSAHVELMRVGSYLTPGGVEDWGGVPLSVISDILSNGTIKIPHIAVTPTSVEGSGFSEPNAPPPEIEVRFDVESSQTAPIDEWPNWALLFVHNQLFEALQFPARFCPGPFHMTYVRHGQFRNDSAMLEYFEHASRTVEAWHRAGPTYLEPESDPTKPGWVEAPIGEELATPHGLYLFKTREEPI
eukprot:SAG31_NODE_7776_length_1599_cov_1.872667_1_plen_409_part_10